MWRATWRALLLLSLLVLLQSPPANGGAEPLTDEAPNVPAKGDDQETVGLAGGMKHEGVGGDVGDLEPSSSSQQATVVVSDPMMASASGHGHGKAHKSKSHKSGHKSVKGKKGKKSFEEKKGHKSAKKGHFKKGEKKKYHDKKGKKHKSEDHKKKYYGDVKKAKKGKKGFKYGSKGHHNKGHKDKGFKNVYHKEEYNQKKKFYDDKDTKKHHDKHEKGEKSFKGKKGKQYKGDKSKISETESVPEVIESFVPTKGNLDSQISNLKAAVLDLKKKLKAPISKPKVEAMRAKAKSGKGKAKAPKAKSKTQKNKEKDTEIVQKISEVKVEPVVDKINVTSEGVSVMTSIESKETKSKPDVKKETGKETKVIARSKRRVLGSKLQPKGNARLGRKSKRNEKQVQRLPNKTSQEDERKLHSSQKKSSSHKVKTTDGKGKKRVTRVQPKVKSALHGNLKNDTVNRVTAAITETESKRIEKSPNKRLSTKAQEESKRELKKPMKSQIKSSIKLPKSEQKISQRTADKSFGKKIQTSRNVTSKLLKNIQTSKYKIKKARQPMNKGLEKISSKSSAKHVWKTETGDRTKRSNTHEKSTSKTNHTEGKPSERKTTKQRSKVVKVSRAKHVIFAPRSGVTKGGASPKAKSIKVENKKEKKSESNASKKITNREHQKRVREYFRTVRQQENKGKEKKQQPRKEKHTKSKPDMDKKKAVLIKQTADVPPPKVNGDTAKFSLSGRNGKKYLVKANAAKLRARVSNKDQRTKHQPKGGKFKDEYGKKGHDKKGIYHDKKSDHKKKYDKKAFHDHKSSHVYLDLHLNCTCQYYAPP